MTGEITQTIEYVRDASEKMLSGLRGFTDTDVRRPSLCPGWTVGHVLTHVARNGDAMRRALEGARRGELVPMYDSQQSRDADIEAGAARPIADLVADVAESARLLAETWTGLDDATWEGKFLHRRFGDRPVRDIPGMRWCELEIHRVDLAGEYQPRDWSRPFVRHAFNVTGQGIARRLPAGVEIDLHATDIDTHSSFGAGQRIGISGPGWALAAWLVGRPVPDSLSTVDGDLPDLAAWL